MTGTAATAPTRRPALPRLHTVPAVVLAVAMVAGALAVGSAVDAVDDVRGQAAYERGDLDTATRYLSRFDTLHDSDTEWRITEDGAWLPGPIEVAGTPGRTRVPVGDDDVTVFYWDGDPVAVELDPAVHRGPVVSVLFGTTGAVLSGLLAVGLLVIVGCAALVLRRRRRTRGWWAPDDDIWAPSRGATLAVTVFLGATALCWFAVAGALPVVRTLVVVEGGGLLVAAWVWHHGRRDPDAADGP